ncbi:AAA family ATPase [Actinoplanes sp. NPDC026619]|uniref:helix-turn-helix transcriptional regulator n=1 Tax=Actinoplanes sp. NPDC026619 TaxID=3155798 RepID=UPI0033E1DFF4
MIGRDTELAQLRALVSGVRLLLGDPGLGKTTLLDEVVRTARARVLRVTGRESERDLDFAGLDQLVRPVLDRVPRLPDRQARALLGAVGLATDPEPPDALLTGLAVLTLLSAVAEAGPVLVTVDDAQWLDAPSLGALAFAARRLDAEPVALLLAARGVTAPAGFDGFPELRLRPLGVPEAAQLLDTLPRPPHGPARERVLSQAAGNPLGLIELSKATGRYADTEPLPLTDRLTAVMTAQFGALPAPTRAALLLVAVADSARVPGLEAAALAPAEHAGLVRVDQTGPRFTHPLVRSAIYHAVPYAERAAAHRRIAAALHDQPDRHSWHLAAAALEPDEQVAAQLEQTATQAQRRGGAAAAARVLERAAALSPAEADQARRLLAAAGLAQTAGQADWVRELATRVLALTTDPRLLLAARQRLGWSLVWSGDHAAALTTLLGVAAEAPSWAALGFAATIAHRTGTRRDRDAVLDTLARMPEPVDEEQQVWVRACAETPAGRAATVGDLHRIAAGTTILGSAAWLLDETDLAVRLLRDALARLRAPGLRGGSGGAMNALQWSCFDSGRWDEALAVSREARDLAAAYRMEPVAASADLCAAAVHALRGNDEVAASLLAGMLAAADTTEYRAAAAQARHVAGLSAFARGDFPAAYAQLRRLFGDDGEPLHHRVSYLGIADLAAAVARLESPEPGRHLVERVLAGLTGDCGPRLRHLVCRTRGLLADPEAAGGHFEQALAEPGQWPFERAQTLLDHGEWLRRRRRINDAKPVLVEALETFHRLRSAPWARRAEAELRACGVQGSAAAPDALAALTAQQREIVILAGRGLTNAEIADHLFLSPRTVASHLYRSYPKLGVAGRHQLRDLIPDEG